MNGTVDRNSSGSMGTGRGKMHIKCRVLMDFFLLINTNKRQLKVAKIHIILKENKKRGMKNLPFFIIFYKLFLKIYRT